MGTGVFEAMIFCSGIWVLLLIVMQFSKEHLMFKQALPFTRKELILSKSVTAAAIAAISAAVYGVEMLVLMKKYDYLIKILNWQNTKILGTGIFGVKELLFFCIAVFLFSLAAYWYLVLCNTLCKNVWYACIMGFLGLLDFILVLRLLGRIDFDPLLFLNGFLRRCLLTFGFAGRIQFLTIILSIFSAVIIALCMPLSLKLYGGGTSRHPFFRYKHSETLTCALIIVFFGSMLPVSFRFENSEMMLGVVTGAVIGAAAAITANKLAKRGVVNA